MAPAYGTEMDRYATAASAVSCDCRGRSHEPGAVNSGAAALAAAATAAFAPHSSVSSVDTEAKCCMMRSCSTP